MVLCMFVNMATIECKYFESDVFEYIYVRILLYGIGFQGKYLCLTFFANVCAVLLYFMMFDLHTYIIMYTQ